MPTVSEQFKSYRDFASASLAEIYGDKLSAAYKVTANTLESGVWINESKKGVIEFSWKPMPWDAQLSPTNAIASGDFNGDGVLEFILAQNQHSNQVETGLWSGNVGCYLEWKDGEFQVVDPKDSGIVLPSDTRSIQLIDIDGDKLDDLIIGQNDDELLFFRNNKKK